MYVMLRTRVCRHARSLGWGLPTPFLGIQTVGNSLTLPPPRILSSTFLTLTCWFLHFHLFATFHVLHSCATMSPNTWPRPEAAVADVGFVAGVCARGRRLIFEMET